MEQLKGRKVSVRSSETAGRCGGICGVFEIEPERRSRQVRRSGTKHELGKGWRPSVVLLWLLLWRPVSNLELLVVVCAWANVSGRRRRVDRRECALIRGELHQQRYNELDRADKRSRRDPNPISQTEAVFLIVFVHHDDPHDHDAVFNSPSVPSLVPSAAPKKEVICHQMTAIKPPARR